MGVLYPSASKTIPLSSLLCPSSLLPLLSSLSFLSPPYSSWELIRENEDSVAVRRELARELNGLREQRPDSGV